MASNPPLEIAVWHGPETDLEDYAHAIQTLEDRFADQIDWPIEVHRKGQAELVDPPYEDYRGYLDAFESAATFLEDAVNLLVYDYPFIEKADALIPDLLEFIDENTVLSCSPNGEDEATAKIDQLPLAGYDRGEFGRDSTPHAIVNADTRLPLLPDPLFENYVMHEVLHAVLDHREAPFGADDHSYGTVRDGRASPMLTGYTEVYSKNGSPPGNCDGEGVPEANFHTTTLSECTREEVIRYLEEYLSSDAI